MTTTTTTEEKAARRSTVTDTDIAALMNEAGVAGDRAEVRICARALEGSKRARAYCVRRIREVRVQFACES